ncbi:LytR/AlgR family response regulator transcription factor [Anaeromicropila populeti]|uniref:Stage 0 sporulation protein A homolog n=1 Tax=Anaeromicropila populeti TaxID=37658 RepID=A0A1I6JPQ6_9FIRM|nr:LytTR family DNA-binding domain-containing protein [Anaeromicropila populeti]SFR80937.1 two component transcriptional regulator, LytTR family [Anaeromicropila populeti]
MLNVLIFDDDKLSVDINKACVIRFAETLNVPVEVNCYTKMEQGLVELMNKKRVHMAILDIDLDDPNQNGLEIAKMILEKNPLVIIIFVTSYSEYALDACDMLAFGFLQKPVETEKFKKLFRKALVQIKGIHTIKNDTIIEITSNRTNHLLKESSILYIEKIGQTVEVTTVSGESYVTYRTLQSYESILSDLFIKINSGVLVNKSKIVKISGRTVVMADKKEHSITIRKCKYVSQEYKNYIRENRLIT